MSGKYWVDARFVNPGGEYLDSRDIPSLTVIPVFLPFFILLLVGWLGLIIWKRRSFLKIHVCLIIVVFVYILELIFNEVALKQAERTDDADGWWNVLIALTAIFDFVFYSTLLIASSGWCLLHTDLLPLDTALSLLGVAVFIAMSSIQSNVDVKLWLILTLILQVVSIVWVLHCIWRNTEKARRHIKAHLIAISRAGIDFRTTPIFEKLALYNILLWVICAAFLAYFLVNVFLSLADASNWVYVLMANLIQFVILAAVMYLYRPRGSAVDRYLQTDEDGDGKNRQEIALEDIDGFALDERPGEMRPWTEDMDLPLEPVIISSNDDMRKSLIGHGPSGENGYTTIDRLV
jgi:hypothetical protein